LQPRPFAQPAKAESVPTLEDTQVQLEHAQHFGHHLANFASSSPEPPPAIIQPKLTIGAPGDKYEQEADRVAQQVVQRIHMPKPAAPSPAQPASAVQREPNPIQHDLQLQPLVQREEVAEEDELQMKPILQRKTEAGAVDASTELESAIQQSRGSGQPMADTIRQPMEHAFGNVDFSGVKVHTDSQSDQLNRSIQAKAFTTGQDIFFRQGAYQPGNSGGQELLAHELTHVVQQNGYLSRSALPPSQKTTEHRLLAFEKSNNYKLHQANISTVQCHSEAALKAQITASSLEDDEETIQTKRISLQHPPQGIQRHSTEHEEETIQTKRISFQHPPQGIQRHSIKPNGKTSHTVRLEEATLTGSSQIQRHSEAALKAQITASSLEDDEETIQTKHISHLSEGIQRHPIEPNRDIFHEASFGERKIDEMKSIVQDPTLIQSVRDALSNLVTNTLNGPDLQTKLQQIQTAQWELVDDVSPLNPAQVKGGKISFYYYHANWYNPDGSPRTNFIKSCMIHEGLHYISHKHQGFQELVPEVLNPLNPSSAETLDEAVTDKIGAEIAEEVLETSEPYTTNYWNLQARRGLDYHMTFKGLEILSTGSPKLWLGKMVDIICAKTNLTWETIKRAYLSDDVQSQTIQQEIHAKQSQIMDAWKEENRLALEAQLKGHAIEKDEWKTILTKSVKEADQEAEERARNTPSGIESNITKEQVKGLVEASLEWETQESHEVVASNDLRSCKGVNDWKVVRENTPHIAPPGGPSKKNSAWDESIQETKWGLGGKAPNTANVHEPTNDPHSQEWTSLNIPDLVLKEYVRKANLLLGKVDTRYPMGWIIIPHTPDKPQDQWLKAGSPFSTYPPASISLLQAKLKNESLSSLTGANPQAAARTVVAGFGGGGYEANGEVGILNIEHVNFSTVVHEMGHHKQNKDQGFNEQSINQVKGVFPLLDLHNILISENKIAASELQKNSNSDPIVRLRYTSTPVRQPISEWVKISANVKAESENYKRFKARLIVKGGPILKLLLDIEKELADNPQLYPGNVPFLFKNYMIDEIAKSQPKVLVEPTDVGI
jgi:hypothetical protein